MPIRKMRTTDADAIKLLVDGINDVFKRIIELPIMDMIERGLYFLPSKHLIGQMQDLFMYWVNNFPNTPKGYKLDIPQQHLVTTHAETEGKPVRLEELIVWLEDLLEMIARNASRKAFAWVAQTARLILNIYDYGSISPPRFRDEN
ncbi:uncharacterized protein FTOL_10573 [Fusarium torulosum]|uniref:Uncharacterized protein n=1 Tax=Fusarium torulosum TaxID=33205 RepID=A0AAE8MGM1_9HYPO|nr:uncharacterized protein FTOL_10573 [Fusarium torulosum]